MSVLSEELISSLLKDHRLLAPRDLARAVEAEVIAALGDKAKKPGDIKPQSGGGPVGGTKPR